MTVLMVLAFAYQLTDNLLHEIIGLSLFILFITHNLLNRKWYCNILKGRYNIIRYLMTITNILLLICMIILAISSIMISRDIFAFLHIKGGFIVRSVHTMSAQWGLLLMSVHLGFHWGMMIRILNNKSNIKTWVMRFVSFIIAIYGLHSIFLLNIGSKLIMRNTFGYWDFKNHLIGFFISYLSIMGFYIVITYYLVKIITKIIAK